jgi:phosphoribosyl 1,2-cyclic phosphodiesterase
MSQVQLRINGKGNAWPVILGQEHPFYDRADYKDLANASCSIFQYKNNSGQKSIEWELIIDVGHGTVQYLLQNENRIPEAILLTHPHIDHILGIDWIIQSYYKTFQKPYPVYASILTWKKTLTAFPHLETLVNFTELKPFISTIINEVPGLQVTAYPVYHGQTAEGAAMLLFETNNKKILITGDVLCPLLRKGDFENLSNIDLMVTDANNRFPYPGSNHWSIIKDLENKESEILVDFTQQISLGTLLSPHIKAFAPVNYANCFDYFFDKKIAIKEFIFDIISFVKKVKPGNIAFVHYSGTEDEKYYRQPILNPSELKSWIIKEFCKHGVESPVIVPYVGQHINV